MQKFCRACQCNHLELIIDLGFQPLAGNFLKTINEFKKEKFYPLTIYCCTSCGLIQLLDVIPSDILFKEYFFSTSTISYLVEHFRRYAFWIKKYYNPQKVLEIGCNDGALLTFLKRLNINAVGIDISKNITEIARSKNLDVITGHFNNTMAGNLLKHFGKFDFITGSNCFPHNDNLDDILLGVKKLLHNDGFFSIEFMYAGDLLNYLQWDSMYHEHLNYFCLSTLETLYNRMGFYIKNVMHLPMHAGSLRVVASPNKMLPVHMSVTKFLRYENKLQLTSVEQWEKFAKKVKRTIKVTSTTLKQLYNTNSISICGYGASGRASMWLNTCNIDYLSYLVDESPLRSGCFIPGVHTPIVSLTHLTEHSTDYIFVPAWNYFESIKKKLKNYNGIWIVPLPNLIFS